MLEVRDIAVSHGGREVLKVDRLSFGSGGMTAILGHNGSGISTLMKAMARQLKPSAGEVLLDGAPIRSLPQRELARRIAFLPQQLPEAAGMSVRELVKLGRFAWRVFVFPAELSPGTYTITSRATDTEGTVQSETTEPNHRGYDYSGWRRLAVDVTVA